MKSKVQPSAACFAPASVGNVAVGFDLLGFALDDVGDTIRVTRADDPGVRITATSGKAEVPYGAADNTAGKALIAMIEDLNLTFGFEVQIEKGIPLGSGMGGSAASAVGAVIAANALLKKKQPLEKLLGYALAGEQVASGSAHLDNVAPCLLGGLTLAKSSHPPDVFKIPVPSEIRYVLVHPHMTLNTKAARAVLKPSISLKEHVAQSALLSGFIAGCFAKDLSLIRRSLEDILIEPQRAHLIPGFAAVKAAALKAGALGCSISGAGPSLFAWAKGDASARKIKTAMLKAFEQHKVAADGWAGAIRKKGAVLVK